MRANRSGSQACDRQGYRPLLRHLLRTLSDALALLTHATRTVADELAPFLPHAAPRAAAQLGSDSDSSPRHNHYSRIETTEPDQPLPNQPTPEDAGRPRRAAEAHPELGTIVRCLGHVHPNRPEPLVSRHRAIRPTYAWDG